MKVLVATKELQGQRKNDFNFCKEGEFVSFDLECDREKIDGNCGCRRSLGGFDTLKATTTFKVVNVKITKKKYIDLLKKSEIKARWYKPTDNLSDVEKKGKYLLDLANSFRVGLVLEKRGNSIQSRKGQ